MQGNEAVCVESKRVGGEYLCDVCRNTVGLFRIVMIGGAVCFTLVVRPDELLRFIQPYLSFYVPLGGLAQISRGLQPIHGLQAYGCGPYVCLLPLVGFPLTEIFVKFIDVCHIVNEYYGSLCSKHGSW